jgi:O-antigen/teichoic acid export membrane protein
VTAARRTRTTAVVALGQLGMNGAAYVFSVVAARVLLPSEFGVVTALLSLLQMGVVASLGLQAAAARRVAVAATDRDETVGTVLRSTVAAAVAVGAAVAILSPALTWLLHLDSTRPALLCAATLVPLTAMGGFVGIAQGSERWGAVTAIGLANGLGRLIGGATALVLHPSVTSAMLGVAVGAWAPVLIGVAVLGIRVAGRRSRKPLIRESIAGTHTLFAFYVLSNADALIARNHLHAHHAGLYAAGLILGKAALMAPSFVGVLLYPRLAQDATASSRRLAVAMVASIGMAATAATALLPDLALILAGGPQYAEVADRLWLFTLAGSIWAVVQVIVLDALARRRAGVARLIWVAAAALPLVSLGLNVGLTGLVTVVAAIGVGLASVLLVTDRQR